MIPLFKVYSSPNICQYLQEVFDSGFTGQGGKVDRFERELQKVFNNSNVVTVNSGTSALQLAIHLLNPPGVPFGPEDEIITTPLGCFASVCSILNNNVKIKWADVDPNTCNIDLMDVKRKLTKNTRAILVVHWGGYPVDLNFLKQIQTDYLEEFHKELPIIEDCAHCWNTKYYQKLIGNSGNYCCFSFQSIKFLTTADGGMLITPNEYITKRAKLLRWFGIDREGGASMRCQNNISESGYKYQCLHKNTNVKLNDSTSKTIMNIVSNKYKGKIQSLDDNNQITNNQIINWYKNPLNNRKWYYLYHQYSQNKRGGGGTNINIRSQKRGVWLTEDHPVLTINGYIPVKSLKETDLLITTNPDLTDKQKQFMVGSMLGDGCIVKRKSNNNKIYHKYCCWYGLSHCVKQKEWFDINVNILSNFGNYVNFYQPNQTYTYQSSPSQIFNIIKNRFYLNDKKIIPKDLSIGELTPMTLATWYMDDGVKNGNGITLCTDRYSNDDFQLLRSLLYQLGFTTSQQLHQSKYNRIGLNKENAYKLWEIIAPFICSALRYKLPNNINNDIPYDPKLWILENNIPRLLSKPFTIKGKPIRYNNMTYCIDVENTHNFVVGGDIVVHNCNNVAATIGLCNLKKVDELVKIHRDNAQYYKDRLSKFDGITLLKEDPAVEASYWLFTIKVDDRENFIKKLESKGIASSPVHARCDKHSCVQQYRSFLPNMDFLESRHVSIPVGWWVSNEDREYIVKTIKEGW
jgi:dTDP-4-amino-4,6-dideoxygalactose transaminase